MIRAIVFDIGGVLIDNPWPQMLSHYASRLNVSEWDLEKFLKESKLMNDWPKGVITESKFWREICNNLDCHLPTSESLWLDGFKLAYRKKPEVFKLIETLQKRGFLIGLLSNTEQPVAEFLKRENFPDLDAFICSCDIGEIKPNPFIYEEMLKKLNLKPNEVVFIDDLKENVEGAKKVGIQAIQFTNTSNLRKELLNLCNIE
jgi:putative hydrolase of the HAD superfamily